MNNADVSKIYEFRELLERLNRPNFPNTDAESQLAEDKLIPEINEYISDLVKRLQKNKPVSWEDFQTFWPPRYLQALQDRQAVIFFGAGVSIPSKIPTWQDLLRTWNLPIQIDTDDEDLKSDPLTTAEIASQYLGNETLQKDLRRIMDVADKKISINHVALAVLRCPIYITTNYDCLFEKAWRAIHSDNLIVVTNDGDLLRQEYINRESTGLSVLYKIHGSSDRGRELMILTRRDYRTHYRTNDDLFNTLKDILGTKHTLFVGFGHRDPEVSRLVEDVIYKYEERKKEKETQDLNSTEGLGQDPRPNIFSLQFDMRTHTPEIFAARGIVALQPPGVPILNFQDNANHAKTKALAAALIDLIGSKEVIFQEMEIWKGVGEKKQQLSIYDALQDATKQIANDLKSAIKKLESQKEAAVSAIANFDAKSTTQWAETYARDWMQRLCDDLGPLASQGVYLLNEDGVVINFEVPTKYEPYRLNKAARKNRHEEINKEEQNSSEKTDAFLHGKIRDLLADANDPTLLVLTGRPYFRQATSFREPFVSDTTESIYNGQSTFCICLPLNVDVKADQMKGLLFAAVQVGQWELPLKIAADLHEHNPRLDLSFFLIDSKGVCMIPPRQEFEADMNESDSNKVKAASEGESANIGFAYKRLFDLSRRDMLVRNISHNIVPLAQDDDISQLSSDYKVFSVVNEIPKTRWKIGISIPVFTGR